MVASIVDSELNGRVLIHPSFESIMIERQLQREQGENKPQEVVDNSGVFLYTVGLNGKEPNV